MRLNIKLILIIAVVTLLAASAANAQDYTRFPGASLDQRTLEAQRRVEVLYSNKEYTRSLLIYEKELAPIGDKYAQYMVGFMYLHGQGSSESRPVAIAWYRLAGERKEPEILQARDRLFQSMTHYEVVESNAVYVELYRELGDNRLILGLIEEDLQLLDQRTGSRVGRSSISPVTIVSGKTGAPNNDAYYDRVRERIEARLAYLKTNVEIIDLDLDGEMAVAKGLEIEVREAMAALDTR